MDVCRNQCEPCEWVDKRYSIIVPQSEENDLAPEEKDGPKGEDKDYVSTFGYSHPRPSNRLDLMSPGERAIFYAMQEVENIGASPELTNVVNVLNSAQSLLYNYYMYFHENNLNKCPKVEPEVLANEVEFLSRENESLRSILNACFEKDAKVEPQPAPKEEEIKRREYGEDWLPCVDYLLRSIGYTFTKLSDHWRELYIDGLSPFAAVNVSEFDGGTTWQEFRKMQMDYNETTGAKFNKMVENLEAGKDSPKTYAESEVREILGRTWEAAIEWNADRLGWEGRLDKGAFINQILNIETDGK
jgi:hypothetical protein